MVRYGSNLRFCSMFSGRQTGSAQMTARVTVRFRFSQSSSQAGQSGQTWSTAVFSSVRPVNWSTRVTRETWSATSVRESWIYSVQSSVDSGVWFDLFHHSDNRFVRSLGFFSISTRALFQGISIRNQCEYT
ncbi:hypothetical protein HanIR_Chr08g0361421 [Helianthus annuus]|nr:hypothetical protein HanIR_Chr08g0361421 [Helianthus annuus]